jgi:mono/diheme cytochrome c family protein
MRPHILAAAASALVFSAGCGGMQAGVDRALQRMRDQPRGGVSQALPPPGTVPRERVLDPALATGRDSSGAHLRRIPVVVTPELLGRGHSRFEIFCGVCHGAGGFGGSVVAANFRGPRPPPLRRGVAATLPPGQVYAVIRDGFGRMPSYAAELSVADRWAVVAYIASLRDLPPADSAERDDSARAAELARLDSVRAASHR